MMADLGLIGKSALPGGEAANAVAPAAPGGMRALSPCQSANGRSQLMPNFYQNNSLAGPATSISGTVTESGIAVARIVRTYSRASGALRGQSTSSGSNGHFSIALTGTDLVYVVALDDLGVAPDYNTKIFDLVVPA